MTTTPTTPIVPAGRQVTAVNPPAAARVPLGVRRITPINGAVTFAPLSATSGMFLGFPGSGKSSLLQSASHGFIFNLDLSVAVHPDFASGRGAELWPYIDERGIAIDGAGKTVTLNYELVQSIVDALGRIPPTDPTRPRFIAFDTLDSLIILVKDWVAKHYQKEDFEEAGMAGWRKLSDEIYALYTKVRRLGFGCFFTAHLNTEKVSTGGENAAVALRLAFRSVTPSINQKLIPQMDHIFLVEAATTTKTTTVNGKAVAAKATTYILNSEKPHRLLADTLKCKAPIPPRLELPELDTFAVIEQAYADAMKKKMERTLQIASPTAEPSAAQ